jgi:hypothetical protein
MNRVYYADNLDVLRRQVDSESIDLVYLDPPFNSNASYSVLFAEHNGAQAASQITAFEDTCNLLQRSPSPSLRTRPRCHVAATLLGPPVMKPAQLCVRKLFSDNDVRVVSRAGIEPATRRLRVCCSAN